MTTPARYRLPPPGVLATRDIAAMGVPPAIVRDWVRRGRLHRCGGSPHYPWYRADDVAPLVAAWQNNPRRRTTTS
ncbi:type IV toxin-antitoxin system AbiEi family antitoxin domain-containing protein [Kitasatospora cineracea]|uniref:type IV toxin-antitoxin system AbiEi family antitoxin domain-containing protein n=1 Tax=Kitasatospora cineracea TaxID=88074 RepID=UPI0036775249